MTITFTAGETLTADELNRVVGLRAVKTATEVVNNSATLQDDDHLFVTPRINTRYMLNSFLMWTSGTTPDIKLTFSIPAGSTMNLNVTTYSRAAAAGTNLADSRMMSQSETVSIPGQGTTFSTQSQWTVITGQVGIGATAGNVTLQWAQNTANASDTSMVIGSWLYLAEL